MKGAHQSNGFWTEQAQLQHATATQCREEKFNFTPVQTCFLGNTVVLASEGDNKEKIDRYSFAIDLDKDTVEFALDNCCTSHVCFEKKLFKEMSDPPPGIGVLNIGGIEKPIGIGTIVFKITDSTLEAKTIELENALGQQKEKMVVGYCPGETTLSSYGTMTHLRNLYHTQLIAEYQCCRHMREERLNMIDFKKNTNPTFMISIAC
eukprot:4494003-Ditylum_brightwellii.AAC.2